MTSDQLHITDAWLNGKYGDADTIYVRSLFKQLESKLATDVIDHKGAEFTVNLIKSWINTVQEIVGEAVQEKSLQGTVTMRNARGAVTKNTWKETPRSITALSTALNQESTPSSFK